MKQQDLNEIWKASAAAAGSGRYLRIVYFDKSGALIENGVSSAVLPAFRLPATRMRASCYVGTAHKPRREAAVGILLDALKKTRKRPAFVAVALICCPSREVAAYRSARARTPGMTVTLTPTTAYMGSFAVKNGNDVVFGDVMMKTLSQAIAELQRAVISVLGAQTAVAEAAN